MKYCWRTRRCFDIPFRRIVVLSFVFAATAAAGDLTICDLNRRPDLVGQIISMSARIGFNMHGGFLLSDSCADRAEGAVLLFPKTAGTPPVNFELDPNAVGRLSPFFRLTGGASTACGVLRGQLVVKLHFHRRQAGAGPIGNGFGPRGASRYAFILQSVTNVHSCE